VLVYDGVEDVILWINEEVRESFPRRLIRHTRMTAFVQFSASFEPSINAEGCSTASTSIVAAGGFSTSPGAK